MADPKDSTPDVITVTPGPKAGQRVALYERDDAHKVAGHADGEVFVSHDAVVKVARTPLVEDKLRSRELVETKDKPTEAKKEEKK